MALKVLSALFGFTLVAMAMSAPITLLATSEADQDIDNSPRPYDFGYEFGDGQGMNQHRRESSDGAGNVKGSYSYTDPYGVYRNVEYQADSNGYRAVVKSNEPGLSNQNPADVTFLVEPPPPAVVLQQNPSVEAVANAL